MTVIIANDVPPATRGMLKRWFIEPKPNVFVGSVNARTREKTLDYIRRNSPGLSMMVIFDDSSSQGYTVLTYGKPDRIMVRKCGVQLIVENPEDVKVSTKEIANGNVAENAKGMKDDDVG